jgi:uncharacterized cupredoxin-like copper-binding protein
MAETPMATGTVMAETPMATGTVTGTVTTGTPTAGMEEVEVTLTEYEIDMPETLDAGTITFNITNTGSEEHSFEIHDANDEEIAALEENLAPGESATLEVTLEAGTYRVYCPVDGHAEEGMELELTVQ